MNDAEFMIKKGMFLFMLGNMFKTAGKDIDFEPVIIWAGLQTAADTMLKKLQGSGITLEELHHYKELI